MHLPHVYTKNLLREFQFCVCLQNKYLMASCTQVHVLVCLFGVTVDITILHGHSSLTFHFNVVTTRDTGWGSEQVCLLLAGVTVTDDTLPTLGAR